MKPLPINPVSSTGRSLKDESSISQASQRGQNQTDLICQAL